MVAMVVHTLLSMVRAAIPLLFKSNLGTSGVHMHIYIYIYREFGERSLLPSRNMCKASIHMEHTVLA